jgi:peptidoglycan/LPS O-acetylase OafA/YrhL
MVRIAALDGMRGVLALSVAVYHFTERALLPGAYIAVDMFFVMSGFILCYAYAPKFERYTLGAFFWRRVARLLPVYLLTGLVLVPMVLAGYGLTEDYANVSAATYSWQGLLIYLGVLQFALPGFFWNIPGWSVSGELWLSLCVFMALPWTLRRESSAWPALAVAALLYTIIVLDKGSLSVVAADVAGTMSGSAFRPLCGFLMGVGIFKLLHARPAPPALSTAALRALEAALVVLCLGLPVFIGRTSMDLVLILAFSALVVLMLSFGDRLLIVRLMSWRPVLYLGAISYSIYLWHMIVQLFFYRAEQQGWLEIDAAGVVSYLVIVVAVSHLSYRFVEVPAQAWINALARSDRPKEKAPAAGAVSAAKAGD